MKWAMPSEGNSSPLFHVVRPATVPAHSFFQIRRPISRAWLSVKRTSAAAIPKGITMAIRQRNDRFIPKIFNRLRSLVKDGFGANQVSEIPNQGGAG